MQVLPKLIKLGDRQLLDLGMAERVAISEGVERIGQCLFWGCNAENVALPSVRTIEAKTFYLAGDSHRAAAQNCTALGRQRVNSCLQYCPHC